MHTSRLSDSVQHMHASSSEGFDPNVLASAQMHQPSSVGSDRKISCVGDVVIDTAAEVWAQGREFVMQLPSVLVIGVRIYTNTYTRMSLYTRTQASIVNVAFFFHIYLTHAHVYIHT